MPNFDGYMTPEEFAESVRKLSHKKGEELKIMLEKSRDLFCKTWHKERIIAIEDIFITN